jgi:DNA damage-binding protein 1
VLTCLNAFFVCVIAGIQKLHIRTVPLGEQPRRISHQSSTKTLGVVTISTASGSGPAGA